MAEDDKEPKEGPKQAKDPREAEPKGTDYTKPTAKKQRGKAANVEKNIKKVVSGDVKVQKRGVGAKLKDLFIAADLKSVVSYVTYDILIPAAKNMFVESVSRGAERMTYGAFRPGRGGRGSVPGERSRITYGGIVNRDRNDPRDPRTRPPSNLERDRYPRSSRNDYIFEVKQDAEEVLDDMYRVLEICDVVSVGDFNEMVGIHSSHADQKWGWEDLRGVTVRDVRSGWVIDLPPPEPF